MGLSYALCTLSVSCSFVCVCVLRFMGLQEKTYIPVAKEGSKQIWGLGARG